MTELTSVFSAAVAWAVSLHGSQRRKVLDTPYAGHLLAVTATVLQYGGSEEEAIAAMLHDAVEDQGGAALAVEIGRRFGPRVAQLVVACSDATVQPKPPWPERKQRHVEKMRTADASVRLIVAADKLDNARSLLDAYRRDGESLWGHFRGGREGTLWYYRAMLEALAAPQAAPEETPDALARRARLQELLAEVDRVVCLLEGLASPLAHDEACQ